jgi:hypothetical protein
MASSRCVRMKSLGNHPMKARRAMLVSAWTTSGFQGSWDGYPSAFIPECLQNIAKKKAKIWCWSNRSNVLLLSTHNSTITSY